MTVGIVGSSGLVGERHIAAWEELGIDWIPIDIDRNELANIDVVDICTPNFTHTNIMKQVLTSSKTIRVICEKPLAISVKDGQQFLDFIKGFPEHRVGIIYQFRFNPKILKLKKELEEARYGEIKLVTITYFRWKGDEYFSGWRGSKAESGGGVVMNITIHYLDLMQWLFGYPVAISGEVTTMKTGIDVEDTAVAVMKFPNGGIGSYVVSSHVDPQYHMEMGVYGTRGHTKINLMENEYHAENFQAFLNRENYVTPVEALKSLKMVEKIYKSL